MQIEDKRETYQPFIAPTIIDKFTEHNIEFIYNSRYDWYRIYLVKRWFYGWSSYWEDIGIVHNALNMPSYAPYYFAIKKYHLMFTKIANEIDELDNIRCLLRDS